MPENEEAVAIYAQVRSQAIYVGMDAVAVDLDYGAVQFVMDLNEVENKFDCFHKVLMMWHHVANINNQERKIKQ